MSRALGLDLGSRRIGVAITDPTATIASPLQVLPRSGSTKHDHLAVAELVAEEEATVVVVGLPLNMNGSAGPAAKAALGEARALATVVGVPVVTFDERRTTVTADQAMIGAGMKAPARRRVVDKVAAAVMLQSWIDAGRPQ
ncbi:MAG TPA: Holliday junction resolvase RuvX [Ilumatobacteraceae bacterium]|jgi:putative Holliday junction resolvase